MITTPLLQGAQALLTDQKTVRADSVLTRDGNQWVARQAISPPTWRTRCLAALSYLPVVGQRFSGARRNVDSYDTARHLLIGMKAELAARYGSEVARIATSGWSANDPYLRAGHVRSAVGIAERLEAQAVQNQKILAMEVGRHRPELPSASAQFIARQACADAPCRALTDDEIQTRLGTALKFYAALQERLQPHSKLTLDLYLAFADRQKDPVAAKRLAMELTGPAAQRSMIDARGVVRGSRSGAFIRPDFRVAGALNRQVPHQPQFTLKLYLHDCLGNLPAEAVSTPMTDPSSSVLMTSIAVTDIGRSIQVIGNRAIPLLPSEEQAEAVQAYASELRTACSGAGNAKAMTWAVTRCANQVGITTFKEVCQQLAFGQTTLLTPGDSAVPLVHDAQRLENGDWLVRSSALVQTHRVENSMREENAILALYSITYRISRHAQDKAVISTAAHEALFCD